MYNLFLTFQTIFSNILQTFKRTFLDFFGAANVQPFFNLPNFLKSLFFRFLTVLQRTCVIGGAKIDKFLSIQTLVATFLI
jgi:hypothetical protein